MKYEKYKKVLCLNFLKILIEISRDFIFSKIINTQSHFSKSFVKSRNILNYLNNNYSKKITNKDIQELFESNYNYLNKVFHKMTSQTIMNYLNNIRIRKAKELMNTTSIKISGIGYLVGINDPYYFSKLFKKYQEMTPTQYIKQKNI